MDQVTRNALLDQITVSADEARRLAAELRREGTRDNLAWAQAVRGVKEQLCIALRLAQTLGADLAEEERQIAWEKTQRPARKPAA